MSCFYFFVPFVITSDLKAINEIQTNQGISIVKWSQYDHIRIQNFESLKYSIKYSNEDLLNYQNILNDAFSPKNIQLITQTIYENTEIFIKHLISKCEKPSNTNEIKIDGIDIKNDLNYFSICIIMSSLLGMKVDYLNMDENIIQVCN